MRHFVGLALIGLAAGCAMNEPAEMSADSEAELGAELASYEQAGPAVSCVSTRKLRDNRSAGENVIIFNGHGGRQWVNRPTMTCPEMNFGRALKTRTTGSQLCRGDLAVVFDPGTGIEYGGCALGDFTPYRRRAS